MGVQSFLKKGHNCHCGLVQAARVKTIVSAVSNLLDYYAVLIVHV